MTGSVTQVFNDLIGLTWKFVEMKDGVWDQNAWVNFLSNIQDKGLDLKSEMQSSLGQVLESVRDVYISSIATRGMEKTMHDMTDITAKFVINNRGVWDHAQWEKYLKDIQKTGIELNAETQNYIGGLLESARKLYETLPSSITIRNE